tara:strand:- start:203 stop:487 length:285 start_codon:yes stop_codon:yes gene_type:complete
MKGRLMKTLASASNQALKTIALTKFENVINKTKRYFKVMDMKYDDFNPHKDETILSAVNDFYDFVDVVEKNNVLPKVVCDKLHQRFVNAYTKGI